MKTETVSFLKKHAADLPVDEPMIITQNGTPKYVVESYEERQRRDDAVAMMKMVMLAKQDVTAGRVSSLGNLKDRLAEKKQRLKGE
ncbi:Phd_YefM [Vibrio aerogenes CECT 7868]|uniref:Phd_YefM n=1 Tax=Vibrio aerogenes CECT 7868 TaxID=1216006 RepID=A0A1M6AE06_9VIBR|nr:prevent-host-death protein [Vibrio aerogenes]SHI34689.1 Phd_YefM [Vibrio aerogenes CECT 7868]